MDAELGEKFRKEILEPGSSRDINDSIETFLGRDWNTDAFFEEMGLRPFDSNETTAENGSGTSSDPKTGSDGTTPGETPKMMRSFYGVVAVIVWLLW